MAHDQHTPPALHGIMAEFDSPTALVEATTQARLQGFRNMDAYTPIPIEELNEALGLRRTRLPRLVLLGGILGGLGGFSLEYWASTMAYPMNIGGRPLNSWPSFLVITFEMTVLFAAFSAVLGMLALNKLPMPYHPVFNVPEFELASRNRFFLMILARDPRFEHARARQFLQSLQPLKLADVPH